MNEWRMHEEWMQNAWRMNEEWMKNEWRMNGWMKNEDEWRVNEELVGLTIHCGKINIMKIEVSIVKVGLVLFFQW